MFYRNRKQHRYFNTLRVELRLVRAYPIARVTRKNFTTQQQPVILSRSLSRGFSIEPLHLDFTGERARLEISSSHPLACELFRDRSPAGFQQKPVHLVLGKVPQRSKLVEILGCTKRDKIQPPTERLHCTCLRTATTPRRNLEPAKLRGDSWWGEGRRRVSRTAVSRTWTAKNDSS